MRTLRQSAALLLALLLFCAQAPAQVPPFMQLQASTVRPNPKRSQKALERADKAQAAGRFDEALMAYEEAALYAPQDASIIERAAALRFRLVRLHVESAERAALAGQLPQATDELAAALLIDPGNSVVAERLGQLKNMDDEPRDKPKSGISGLPRLEPQPGKRNLNLRGDTKTTYEHF